jgi:hypothetical protein
MGFQCPWGHQSTNDEYCDFCGALNPAAQQLVRGSVGRPAGGVVAVAEQPCVVCGTERDGTDRYCANCGYDFEMGEPLPTPPEGWETLQSGPDQAVVASSHQAPAPPRQGTAPERPAAPQPPGGAVPQLVLLVGVNTRRFDDPGSPPPPADLAERVFMIDRSPILIGRDGPGLQIPVRGDPYVSRRHAEVVWMGTTWGIRDLGSTNGTRVNGTPVEGSEIRPLAPEDVIEVGFFTQLRVRGL